MSFADLGTAAKVRDLVRSIAKQEIEKLRPNPRYGTVDSIDTTNRVCSVVYPESTGSVPVKMGVIRPSAVGQVVRVEGPPNDRHVADVLGTASLDAIGGGGGVTDHGLLTGILDDDHTQYFNTTRHDAHDHSVALGSAVLGDLGNVSSATPASGQVLAWSGSQWAPITNAIQDHGGLTGLSDDDHPQYVNLARHALIDHGEIVLADLDQIGNVTAPAPHEIGEVLNWGNDTVGWSNVRTWDLPYETAPVTDHAVQNPGNGSVFGNYDGWGLPRPDRYEWPPTVIWNIHFQVFSGTTALPASINGIIDKVGRWTIAEIAAVPTERRETSNYFAHEAARGWGYAFTKAVERIEFANFSHHKLYRRDIFKAGTPQSGGFARGGLVSSGIAAYVPEHYYEMIVEVVDERPDWYPNISSTYEMSVWHKWAHMFADSHWDTACTGFKTDIEAAGLKARVYYDMEIKWDRRTRRTAPNGGTLWPYESGGGSVVSYPAWDGGTLDGVSPATNPIPENSVTYDSFPE